MDDRLSPIRASRSAAVKAGLDHPVIDTDVHVDDKRPRSRTTSSTTAAAHRRGRPAGP